MNMKSIVSLEFTKNNKEFVFNLPAGSLFAECYEVVDELIAQLKSMEEQQKSQAAQNESKSEPVTAELV